ncbi:sensor histidine kinase [Dissulfuribacter thermophilus]|uniref:sensor histidine kinase n=1 Tax=Dissulfuribacter thermophilus TaxID=1156395 RepID=UPI001FC94B41|nr:sensor histidine kinase [Dissulfuribacter thermophilus]
MTDLIEARELESPEKIKQSIHNLEEYFLKLQKLNDIIQAIRFIDEKGNVWVKVREGKIIPRKGPLIANLGIRAVSIKKDRDFFKKTMLLNNGEVWISNLEKGWMEGQKKWCPAMVRFSTPLFFSNGKRAGILIINVWGKQVGKMINRLISPQEGMAFLIERNLLDEKRNGIFLFHKKCSCEFGNQTGSHITVFQRFPDFITKAWMHTDKGIILNPKTKDILAHRFFSPYHSKKRGWVVVVQANSSFFMAPLTIIENRIIISALLMVLLAVLAALYFAQSITEPIKQVIDGTHRISQNLSNRISIKSTDEIGILAQKINNMASQLQKNIEERKKLDAQIYQSEKLASIGEMAAGLAHELNTPLSNIKAIASLSKKDLDTGKINLDAVKEDLNDIKEQTEKCSEIISGLLSFARKRNPEFALFNINDLIEKALSLLRLKIEKKGVTVRFQKNEDPLSVNVDANQIQQVFVNILLNALDVLDFGGLITIISEKAGNHLKISIKDNGPGIPPDIMPKIFNPFFSTKEVGKGTGLGLSVSYGIVKNHGGTIEVQSKPGQGTTFTVKLPMNSLQNNGNDK